MKRKGQGFAERGGVIDSRLSANLFQFTVVGPVNIESAMIGTFHLFSSKTIFLKKKSLGLFKS